MYCELVFGTSVICITACNRINHCSKIISKNRGALKRRPEFLTIILLMGSQERKPTAFGRNAHHNRMAKPWIRMYPNWRPDPEDDFWSHRSNRDRAAVIEMARMSVDIKEYGIKGKGHQKQVRKHEKDIKHLNKKLGEQAATLKHHASHLKAIDSAVANLTGGMEWIAC